MIRSRYAQPLRAAAVTRQVDGLPGCDDDVAGVRSGIHSLIALVVSQAVAVVSQYVKTSWHSQFAQPHQTAV